MEDRHRDSKGRFINENKRIVLSCQLCGNPISTTINRVMNGRGKFCSRRCLGKFKFPKGEKHPNYNFNAMMPLINGKQIHVSRLIAEKVLGRKLKSYNEVVHHIDGNRNNNENCNLLICTPEYHRQLHYRINPIPYDKGLKLGREIRLTKFQRLEV